MNKEVVVYEGWDTGWDRKFPVTLIYYESGSMDLHRQSGDQFTLHIEEAEKVLKQIGLQLDPNDKWMPACTGLYRNVIPIPLEKKG